MKWKEFKSRPLKYLNLGGGRNRHGEPNYGGLFILVLTK